MAHQMQMGPSPRSLMQYCMLMVTQRGPCLQLLISIILRFTWLTEYNPEINWKTHKVTMSCCPNKYHTCQTEIQEEQKALPKSAEHIQACRRGSFLSLTQDKPMLDFDLEAFKLTPDVDQSTDLKDKMLEGVCLFCTSTPPLSKGHSSQSDYIHHRGKLRLIRNVQEQRLRFLSIPKTSVMYSQWSTLMHY